MLQGYTKQRFNYKKSHLDNKDGLYVKPLQVQVCLTNTTWFRVI